MLATYSHSRAQYPSAVQKPPPRQKNLPFEISVQSPFFWPFSICLMEASSSSSLLSFADLTLPRTSSSLSSLSELASFKNQFAPPFFTSSESSESSESSDPMSSESSSSSESSASCCFLGCCSCFSSSDSSSERRSSSSLELSVELSSPRQNRDMLTGCFLYFSFATWCRRSSSLSRRWEGEGWSVGGGRKGRRQKMRGVECAVIHSQENW